MSEPHTHQPKKMLDAILSVRENKKGETITSDDYAKAISEKLADRPEKTDFTVELVSPRKFKILPRNVYSAVLLYHDRTYDQISENHEEKAYAHQDEGTFSLDEDGDVMFIRKRDNAMYPCFMEITL